MSIIARRPDQNAYLERFNRSYRTEVLNAHLFESIAELPALSLLGNTPDGREADTRSRANEADRRRVHHNEDSGPLSPSGPGVAPLPDLTSLRHAPQALNLPQPSVELVPTRENAASTPLQFARWVSPYS